MVVKDDTTSLVIESPAGLENDLPGHGPFEEEEKSDPFDCSLESLPEKSQERYQLIRSIGFGGMKCVLDRLMLAAGCGVNQFHHKVGGALCTLRRSGGSETYHQLLATMDCMEMVVVTSDYWGAVHGADPGEAMKDEDGVAVAAKLGRNMAWMVKVLNATKETLPAPETGSRPMFNYIR